MWRSAFIASLAALAAAPLCHADGVYRSVDAQGHVVYSDRAPTRDAQKSTIKVIEGDPQEAARTARQTQLLKAEDNVRKQQQDQENRTKAQQDHDKQVRCDSARNRFYALKDANLLYKRDAQGNRQYYSDTEAEARREQARQAMVAACGA